MEAIGNANQLRCDPHLRAVAAHAALDDIRHPELATDLPDVAALVLELKHRSARYHLELRHLGEDIQQLFRHAVGEIILLSLAAHVCEWQDGDRIAIGGRRREHIALTERWLAVEIPAQSKKDEQHSGGGEARSVRS